jgi:hypothetical protein
MMIKKGRSRAGHHSMYKLRTCATTEQRTMPEITKKILEFIWGSGKVERRLWSKRGGVVSR